MFINTKERSTDRIFVLSPRPGEKTKSSTGLVDPRLFNGENRLHAVMDDETCHWYMKYDKGGLPEPLKGMYTNFPKLVDAAKSYFNTRNVDIKEIIA